MCQQLSKLIEKHHLLFLKLFPLHLTPKYHFLTHYPFIIKKIGPLTKIMTLRYESKHRQSKLAANVVSSRVNITRTLALKHQLQLTKRMVNNDGFTDRILYDGKYLEKTNILNIIPTFKDILRQTYAPDVDTILEIFETNVSLVKRITFNNVIFKKDDLVLTHYLEEP
ncbi:unnamed protein product [Psylliodes chrysocephalus]|uniref:Uncharacterized protein n=1 Tax=Psylliodes chrysocephalus TaxID=3402493 RepID=A0A9P0GBP1_9CUCU|nr:unnamed protein product [Psylliodes chrysocephala]